MSSSHYFSHQLPLSRAEIDAASRLAVRFEDKTLEFVTSAAVFSRTEFDVGSRLLLAEFLSSFSDKLATTHVCDLGCGWGPVGAFAAAQLPQAQIFAVDLNPRAAALAAFNFRSNDLTNAHAWCGDGLSAARPEFFDAVLLNPPVRAGNAAMQKLFEDAYRGLKSGGEGWFVVRTAQGAKSWQKRLAALFGDCETVQIDKGFRVLRCIKSDREEA